MSGAREKYTHILPFVWSKESKPTSLVESAFVVSTANTEDAF